MHAYLYHAPILEALEAAGRPMTSREISIAVTGSRRHPLFHSVQTSVSEMCRKHKMLSRHQPDDGHPVYSIASKEPAARPPREPVEPVEQVKPAGVRVLAICGSSVLADETIDGKRFSAIRAVLSNKTISAKRIALLDAISALLLED